MGNFDLDPDRVLDLIIESCTRTKCPALIMALLTKFKPESISIVLGNRILRDNTVQASQNIVYAGPVENFMTSSPQELYAELGFIVSPKIISITCELIKANIVPLESVFPYLNPSDGILQRIQAERLENGKHKVMKSFKMILEEIDDA